MRRFGTVIGILSALAFTLPACTASEDVEDGIDDAFPDGKADGGVEEGSPEALGVLAFVNDQTLDGAAIKAAAGVTIRVGNNIVKHRDGADGVPGTSDDDRFDTLAELDAIPYVGPVSLRALIEAARERGLITEGARFDVIFSPQAVANSHNARIAQMIRDADHTVDIAMYSYSDSAIGTALADAVDRGVRVRFLFETARTDKNVTDPAALAATKSGRLEANGIDVRYVNKILHHKFAIIDGPRDDAGRTATAKIVSGSGNWSHTAATQFDENTLFIEQSVELAATFQNEFDLLWQGSRELSAGAEPQGLSTANVTPQSVADEPGVGLLLTRHNMRAAGADGTTWTTDKNLTKVSDQWVAAIERATTSILIGSGHIRLRPVAEALIAKKQANPAIDIKVYLDQQEFISASGDAYQKAELEDCYANAVTPAETRDCGYNNFLFSKALVDGGIEVRFKSYSYRWDHSYAAQMHSKYMIVDGKELISGSYNLSMNAEHASFENAVHLSGTQFRPIIEKFEQNFQTMWDTNRAGDKLAALRNQISTSSTIPLVFPPIALTWSEYDQLRVLIRQNCTLVDSTDYRTNPAAHKTCPRS